MSEIVFYDANPTVRTILSEQFSTYGLKLVTLQGLDKVEDELKKCNHPVIIVLDMSREPEMLPKLQAIVPQYIRAPERCILTSVQPTALAPYLPKQLDDCFFKHVVERPFKRLDFIHFFDTVVKPYLAGSKSVQLEPASLVNSSVSQIIVDDVQPRIDSHLTHEVEEIVQSTSNAVALDKLKEDAREKENAREDDSSQSMRLENRISRRSRSRIQRSVPSPASTSSFPQAVPKESSGPVRENSAPAYAGRRESNAALRAVSRVSRENSAPSHTGSRRESSAPGYIPTRFPRESSAPGFVRSTAECPPSSQPSFQSVPAKFNPPQPELDVVADDSMTTDFGTIKPRQVTATPIVNPYLRALPGLAALQRIENSISDTIAEFSDENTHIVAPFFSRISTGSVTAPDVSANAPAQPEHDIQFPFQFSSFLNMLRQSLIRRTHSTLVCTFDEQQIIIFIHEGSVSWIELITRNEIPGAESYFKSIDKDIHIPVKQVLSLVQQNNSVPRAFSIVNADIQAYMLAERQIRKGIAWLRIFESKPCRLYPDIPAQWKDLSEQRPVNDVDIFPLLFEDIRSSEELVVVPDSFEFYRFCRRPCRTPWNTSVQLNKEEQSLLNLLGSPKSIAELRRTGRAEISAALYRLVMFEFVDLVK